MTVLGARAHRRHWHRLTHCRSLYECSTWALDAAPFETRATQHHPLAVWVNGVFEVRGVFALRPAVHETSGRTLHQALRAHLGCSSCAHIYEAVGAIAERAQYLALKQMRPSLRLRQRTNQDSRWLKRTDDGLAVSQLTTRVGPMRRRGVLDRWQWRSDLLLSGHGLHHR